MSNLGLPVRRYITIAIIVNMMIAGVVLTAASEAVACFTSYHVWSLIFADQPFELWRENFFREFLRGHHALVFHGGWTLFKVMATSIAATTIALTIGLRRKNSVISINHAIARSIIFGASATLLIHAISAVLQF
jgi:hypothetical protein